MDMADLDAKLTEAKHARVKLIATDGTWGCCTVVCVCMRVLCSVQNVVCVCV